MATDPGLPPNYFDKVLLVGEIARLETMLAHERTAREQAVAQAKVLAEHLRTIAGRTAAVLQFPLDKIPVLVQSLRPWLAKENQSAFDLLASDPGFRDGLGTGVRALFLEALAHGRTEQG